MKTFFQFTAICFCLTLATTLSAQWTGSATTAGEITRDGEVGIGVSSVTSTFKLHVETPSLGNNTVSIYGEVLQPVGFSDRVRGVYGRVNSGAGWATGVYGTATTPNPSNDGRSFGVYGIGGNATPGANYGGLFYLSGSNSGVAMMAVDRLTPEGDTWASTSGLVNPNRSWAGYFIGDVQMSSQVGIGCDDYTAPAAGTVDYRLFINGGIRALELHVDNSSWCDYVFESDYKLKPLEEVEAHIEAKGHLHNTPSAEEIETNGGFELSEMTRNQQEKIEEIFLHLIELNKEVATLKAENADLKAALEAKD